MPSSDRVRGRSRSAAATYRATAMDRVFADSRIVAVTGPSTGLDAAATRTMLAVAESSSPTARVALDPRADTSRWEYRIGLADTDVELITDIDTTDLGRLLTEIRHRPRQRGAVEVALCGDYVVVDYSHGVGDGQLGVMLLAACSDDRDGSRAPTLAAALPADATWRALRRHYSAHPSAIKDFWLLRRAHKRRPESSTGPTRRIDDWQSGKVSRCGYMAPGQVRELKQWSKLNAQGATSASISVALWAAALRAENVDVDDHIMILFNSRRYLEPEYAGAHGNFAVGIPLHLPSSTTPTEIAATMRQVIESGWPIAILGMSEIKDKVDAVRSRGTATRSDTGATTVEVPRSLRLAVSDLGKLAMLDHIEWSGDGRPPQLAASLDPDGPDGMTMLISEVAGGRTYTASFCSTFVDPAVVEAALARVCADPVALLRHSPGVAAG